MLIDLSFLAVCAVMGLGVFGARGALRVWRGRGLEVAPAATLAQVLATIDHGILITDSDGRLRYWSKNAEEVMGYPPGFLRAGMAIRDLVRVYAEQGVLGPGDIDDVVERKLREFREQPVMQNEMRVPSGRYCIYRRWPTPDGGLLMVAVDISAQKDVELRLQDANESIARTNEQLEARVAARTEALRDARDMAEAANRAKSRFIDNVSHEMRTPLNGVMGTLELLYRSSEDDHLRRRIDFALRSSESLLALINDVLDFAKMTNGEAQLACERFDLEASLRRSMERVRRSAELKGLRLETRLHPNAPRWVVGDERRLSRVIYCLLDNAIKFTATGRIELRLESSASENRDEASTPVLVKVTDTGCGIAASEREHVFGQFSRAQDSHTRIHGGVGLGLAACKQLVSLMGGTIEVDTNPAGGSVFRVEVPMARADAPQVSSGPAGRAPRSSGDRVLVVEDNPLNREVIVAMLESLQLDCDAVSDGLQAVEAVTKESYDLFLMDCQMPRLDGYQATQRIREHESSERAVHTPIVAFTAHGERTDCTAAGMDDYLEKPVRTDTLAAVIDRWIPRAS